MAEQTIVEQIKPQMSLEKDIEAQTKVNKYEKIDNTSQEFGLMITLQENLNLRIGTERWKKYINSVFWYYISTPINFTITLFTALSSGQVGTNTNFLSNGALFGILFTTFLLSTINTFFKLKETNDMNTKVAKEFEDFAIKFEEIYFTPINSDSDIYKRYINYKKLQYQINDFCKTSGIENNSYITALMYSCCKYMCFKGKIKLIGSSERFWVLDGKKKNDDYNKKSIIVDTSNFELDTERIREEDLDKYSLHYLKSREYTPRIKDEHEHEGTMNRIYKFFKRPSTSNQGPPDDYMWNNHNNSSYNYNHNNHSTPYQRQQQQQQQRRFEPSLSNSIEETSSVSNQSLQNKNINLVVTENNNNNNRELIAVTDRLAFNTMELSV